MTKRDFILKRIVDVVNQTAPNSEVYLYGSRAKDTLDDARILAEKHKWNSTINRLYYASYYAVMALLFS